VVAINWGPWEGGMISDQLRDLYASKGVHLIPTQEGTRMCLSELRRNGASNPEVLIACNIRTIAAGGLGETA
jgi:hypothetical protein